jgi:hypothetical protein
MHATSGTKPAPGGVSDAGVELAMQVQPSRPGESLGTRELEASMQGLHGIGPPGDLRAAGGRLDGKLAIQLLENIDRSARGA